MNALMTLLFAVNVAAQTPAAPAKPDAAKLFAAKCSACHAKDGKGSAAMAKMFHKDPASMNLTSEGTVKKADADLAKTITDGRDKMPSFKGKLKDSEISALVDYIRSLSAAPKAPAPAGK
jgi:mono/diheme cytochrome c family protein